MLEKEGYRTEKNQCEQYCSGFVWDRGVVEGCNAVGVQEVKQRAGKQGKRLSPGMLEEAEV